jgi:hypothetical protein
MSKLFPDLSKETFTASGQETYVLINAQLLIEIKWRSGYRYNKEYRKAKFLNKKFKEKHPFLSFFHNPHYYNKYSSTEFWKPKVVFNYGAHGRIDVFCKDNEEAYDLCQRFIEKYFGK